MADQEFTAGELRPPKTLKSSVTVMVYYRNPCLARVMRRLGTPASAGTDSRQYAGEL